MSNSDIISQLDEIGGQSIDLLNKADTLPSLEVLRVKILGKKGSLSQVKDRKFYRVIKSPASENGRCILVSVPEGQAGSRAEVVAA